ncbi:ADP-dependent (S)-NAD(P)H-hydrate dehydratase [Microbacterium oxydans]|uniref:ADP-dependent (S)-NAD(P)H-hydrate dehydratase n=1 Tax=Microbacterium oxydans TaxID=82380 RepID=A0A0F0KBP1_9MICO|nr:NAD(P)H-hydrate dehydratase [Microbacterium oxydans]KJL18288.1 ADP-dependent (S)-NAD(P)H-hydrate dehydratase [Microbacterium oxydans]
MVEVREWTREDTARLFRVPTADDDKYARGVVALRTGSPAYPGAAVLGVEAAWRTGAGFVRYVGAERMADAVLARRPETVAGADVGRSRIDAWVIGSGTDPTDRDDAEQAALEEIVAGDAAVVIDAGALDLAEKARARFLVTPHAREFARLQERLGVPGAGEDRVSAARRTADRLGGTVLLKGARTLIASPEGDVIAVDAGTGWLATAGTGDVLAGVLGTVLAANQGSPIAEVAAAGAWIHGHAGRVAAGMSDGGTGHPIVAMDVAAALPDAIADVLA